MRKLIVIFVVILLGVVTAALSFVTGRWWGNSEASGRLMHEEMSRCGRRAALDRSVLGSFSAYSNTLASGTYLMDIWFPKSKLPTREVVLECERGQISALAFSRNRGKQEFSVGGSVISWTQEGAGYEANAEYVGVIDGNEMWGRVYGWNPGDESVGLWRIYPKPEGSGKQEGAANGGPKR